MASKEELAFVFVFFNSLNRCVYSTLILHDDGIAVSAQNINAILNAANVKVASFLPALFAKLLLNKNVEDFIFAGGAAAAPAPVAVVSSGNAAAPAAVTASQPAKEEEKKKEEKKEEEEEDFDMGGLFD
jgi:large subunit ribosomal protein LP1